MMQDGSQTLQQYLDSCKAMLTSQNEDTSAHEEFILKFLRNPANFEHIKHIFENQNDPHLKLITLEFLSKAFTRRPTAGAMDSELRYRSVDELHQAYNSETPMMLDYFIYYLRTRKTSDPTFVTNSVCDFYGNLLKYLVANSLPLPPVEDIQGAFFHPAAGPDELLVGLKLLNYCLTNILLNSHHYGYFKFRKMIYLFQSKFLIDGLNLTRHTLKGVIQVVKEQGFSKVPGEILRVGLELYYKCLTFPFNITYFDFNSDQGQSDITITIFPDGFAQTLADLELNEGLFWLVSTAPADTKLSSLRSLSKMASGRLSLFDDQTKEQVRQRFIASFPIVVRSCPLDDLSFCTEIAEFLLRLIFLFGYSQIKQHPLYQLFQESVEHFCRASLSMCKQIDCQLFMRLVEVWQKVDSAHTSQDDAEKSVFMQSRLRDYSEMLILQNNNSNFYVENVRSAKKFIKSVNQRFDVFKDFARRHSERSVNMLAAVTAGLSQQEGQLRAGYLDPNVYLSQIGHFVLVLAKSFYKSDISHIHFQNYIDDIEMSNSDNDSPSPVIRGLVEMTAFVLNAMKFAQGLVTNVRIDVLVGFEMSLLFFLETLMVNMIENNIVAENGSQLTLNDPLAVGLMERLGMSGGFQEFFELITNKILGNFEYRSLPLSELSIAVLKVMIEKLKRQFKGKSRANPLIDSFTSKLQNINFSVLSERQFYKLRSKIFELIALGYLDDSFDDYVNNSHSIFERILTTNTVNGNVDLMKVFFDMVGIYKGISLTKIIVVFSKITYPKMQELIQTLGPPNFGDPEFVSALLEFYNTLVENTSQKYAVAQTHVVMYKITTDTCQLVSIFLSDINRALEQLNNSDAVLKFLETNLKIVKKLFRIFKSMLKFSDLAFSIFHFFGYTAFLELLKGIHAFMSLTGSHIVRNFPDKAELFLDCFKESCSNLSDFIVEHFNAQELSNVFGTLHVFFVKKVEEAMESTETNALQDESTVQYLSTIVNCLCVSIYELACVSRNDPAVSEKIAQVSNLSLALIRDFVLKLIELSIKVNYSVQVSNLLADILFNFVTIFGTQTILPWLAERVQVEMKLAQKMEDMEVLRQGFQALEQNVQFRLELFQRERFHDKFKEFVQLLCKLGEEKNKVSGN